MKFVSTKIKQINLRNKGNITEHFKKKKKYDIDDKNRDALNFLYAHFVNQANEEGLFLAGKVGTGKTTAMLMFHDFIFDILSTRLHPYLSDILFMKASTIEIVADYEKIGPTSLQKYKVGVWLFDDLGKETTESQYYGTKKKVMRELLATRYDLWKATGMRTYITSNYSLTSKRSGEELNFFENKYGDHVYDRMQEMFIPIIFKGVSRRTKNSSINV